MIRMPVLLALGVLLCLLPGIVPPALALDVPPLEARVNDLADILSPATEQLLEANLARLEEEDSTQIAVLTIAGLEGENLEAFSLRVAEHWRLGQKRTDNGALLLVAVQDRALRIEVGYGLEGRLTDLVSGRIIRHEITPAFRQGNYDQGVINGVEAMIRAVKGEYSASAGAEKERSDSVLPPLVMISWVLGSIFRRRWLLATLVGGAGGLGLGLVLPTSAPLLFVTLAGAVIALVAAAFASASKAGRVPGDGRRIGHSSGSRSGGFSGGGGFRGGGGGFGGGGASGRW